jgi:hypothetical protein
MSDIYKITLTTQIGETFTGKMSRGQPRLENGFVVLGTVTLERMVRQGETIYPTDHDFDFMDRQTKKDILAHNKSWQANCKKGAKTEG